MSDTNPFDALDDPAAGSSPAESAASGNPFDALDDDGARTAYSRNRAWAKPEPAGGYQTKLSDREEPQFERWVKDNHVPFDPSPTADYDMRGFWKGLQNGDPHAQTGVNQNDHQLHFSDYWKTPYHKSFSAESQWATSDAPRWNDRDQFVTPKGDVVFDERAQSSNPFDTLDSPAASDSTASRMQDVTDQAQMPEVTVSARRPVPEASWSDVAAGIPTAIGAGIEKKVAGAQEFIGHTAYDDARKKFWQATILPQAVRDAKEQNVSLTDLPEVQATARHLGIRPDVFTRDWPTYVNESDEDLNAFKAQQRDRIQVGSQQIASGTRKRLTAQQVQEAYAPRMDEHSLKSVVFDAATMAPDLIAGVGGTVATGGVGGAAIMAADIAPNMYAEARNRGLDHNTASTYAILSTLASSVPEIPVLKVVQNTPLAQKIIGSVVGEKLAATGAGKVAGTAAAQGVTQSVVNALQQGIDAGVLNEHLPLDEALKQVAWSGLVGGVVGAPMGVYHAAQHRFSEQGQLEADLARTRRLYPQRGPKPDETAPEAPPGEAAAAAAGPSSEQAGGPSPEGNSAGQANPEETAPSMASPSVEPSPQPIDMSAAQVRHEAPPSTSIDASSEEKGGSSAPNIQPELSPQSNRISGTATDEHAALLAVKNKTVTPPQADLLEDKGLIKRNDLGEPVMLPAGRRRLTTLERQAAEPPVNPPSSAQVDTKAGIDMPTSGQLGEIPESAGPTGSKPQVPEPPKEGAGSTEPEAAAQPPAVGGIGNNRLATDNELRQGLAAMKDETGWAQVGGRVLRDASTDQVTGRTNWIPNADWWPGRPKGLKESEVHTAIDKALAGQPLKKREQAMVDYMTQVHDERVAMAQTHEELRDAVPDLQKQPEGSLDLTLLASRAAEFDPNEAARIMDTLEDDKPATIARIRGQFEQIIGRGHSNKETLELAAQDGRAAESAPVKRTPAALDLFGQDRTGEQALADETRRRDALRSPNRDVPLETGAPGDLFSQSRRQVDFTDQLKQARQDTNTEPTEGQKAAGNYAKGELNFGGMNVSIENPKGSTRSGVDAKGKRWSSKLAHDYGYINRTEGHDGDHVDAFLTGKPDTGKVYVVNQIHPDKGTFDEHKAILGAASEDEARAVYLANYSKGWKGAESIAELSTPDFRKWVHSGGPVRGPIRPPSKLERRTEAARRKRVAEMTAEEAKKELLTHDLTGIPNRRAYQEAEKLPHQVSIDVDSLKWVNDNMGHESGNELLKAIASSLSSHTDNVFHLSGDEFAAQAHTETEAHELMNQVSEHLKGASIEVEMPDGRVVKLKGMGVSYGVGETLEEADAALQKHKTRREAEGARAARGEAPPGAIIRAREEGRENQASGPAEGVEQGPKSRRSEEPSDRGMPAADVGRIVHSAVREAGLGAGFPHVEVHQNVDTLPQHIRDLVEQQGARDTTGAVYDPQTGRIHLIAENNGSEQEVRENLWHEAVGHHGLRMAMEPGQYQQVMDGIARDMPERVEAAARRNGLNMADPAQRRAAAEEVVAYAAGQHLSGQPIDKPAVPWFNRVMRAVKGFFSRMTGRPFYDDRAIAGLIEHARQALEHGGSFNEPGEAARSTRAPTFYSALERAVETNKQGKASGEQWAATIKRTAGVKPGELEFMDLDNWLKGQKSVTREQLLDYVRAHKLQLTETRHGAGTQTEDEKHQIQLAEELRSRGYRVTFDNYGNLATFGLTNESLGISEYAMHDPQEVDELHEHLRRVTPTEQAFEDLRDKIDNLANYSTRVALLWEAEHTGADYDEEYGAPRERGAKYSQYTLPGGQNYRELLLQLPAKNPPASFEQWQERRGYYPTDNPVELAQRRALYESGDAPNPEQPEGAVYRSSHWDEPNILAHVRFNDRTDADGKKVLHLEELQSDWHQAGRRYGYGEMPPEIAARNQQMIDETRRLALDGSTEEERRAWFKPGTILRGRYGWNDLVIAYHAGDAARRWSVDVQKVDREGRPVPGEHPRNHSTDPSDEIRYKIEHERLAMLEPYKGRVPEAPLKTSWPMLVMKRMIRWAAEGGYDRITWTTGDQQNARYGLSQHVESVDWLPLTGGRKQVTINLVGRGRMFLNVDANGVVSTQGQYEGRHLAELLGQQIADRALSEKAGSLDGDDIRGIEMGGEGMRGFYADILPRETGKLIKKYGGKVEDSTVNTQSLAPSAAEMRRQLGRDDGPAWMNLEHEEQQAIYREYKERFGSTGVHGFDITPQMRQAALGEGFPMFSRRQQPLPLEENRERGPYAMIRRAVNAVHDSKAVRDVRKLVNPVGMSPESRQTAQIARAALGELAHETVKTQEALEHFSRQVDRMPITDQLEMMDAIERGAEQPHPELQPVADEMRKTLDTWREKVRGLGEGYLDNFIENYFPHYWRDQSEAQRMVASIMGRRPLRGAASFLKMRTIPSIKEGMDAGLTPLTTNPLVMTLLKTREMQRFVSGVTLMRRFKEDGLARFLPSGKPMPDGWAPINDSIAKVRQWSEAEAGFIDRGQYIMPLEAARVINNHVSASALRDFAPAQIFRRGANALNAMQLGFSAFHLGFTTLDAMISKNAQGIERLLHGDVAGAARSFGEGVTPVGAVRNVHRGYKLLQAYTNPAGATPDMQKLVDMLRRGGGRAHMDRYYLATEGFTPFRGVGIRSLASDVHQALTAPQDKLERLGKAVGNFPAEYANKLWRGIQEITQTTPALEVPVEMAMRVVRASTSWIMEHLVPMQKLGVFADLAADHLRRNPIEDPNERDAAAQRIWDSVDNRLGEMVYDNLFWNRTLKDTLHLGIRAVGWNLGTIREIGGAPVDIIKAIDKRIRTGELSAADLGHRIPYVLAMTATTALYASIYQYMATGQGPQELKDYFFPRTGGVTNYGTPQRVSLPSYVKDVYEYSQRPGTTVVNKLNPIFSLLGNLYSNQDFFGNPIADPEAGYWQQKLQQLEFVGKEARPFSLQGREQMQQSDQKPGFGASVRKSLTSVGVTPAPGYITSGEQIERRERLEQDQKYTHELMYQMRKAQQAGDKEKAREYKNEYVEAVKRMNATKAQVQQDRNKAAAARRKAATTMRQSGFPATASLVESLPLEPDAKARDYFMQVAKAAA